MHTPGVLTHGREGVFRGSATPLHIAETLRAVCQQRLSFSSSSVIIVPSPNRNTVVPTSGNRPTRDTENLMDLPNGTSVQGKRGKISPFFPHVGCRKSNR